MHRHTQVYDLVEEEEDQKSCAGHIEEAVEIGIWPTQVELPWHNVEISVE